jgi:hypothetical protein
MHFTTNQLTLRAGVKVRGAAAVRKQKVRAHQRASLGSITRQRTSLGMVQNANETVSSSCRLLGRSLCCESVVGATLSFGRGPPRGKSGSVTAAGPRCPSGHLGGGGVDGRVRRPIRVCVCVCVWSWCWWTNTATEENTPCAATNRAECNDTKKAKTPKKKRQKKNTRMKNKLTKTFHFDAGPSDNTPPPSASLLAHGVPMGMVGRRAVFEGGGSF